MTRFGKAIDRMYRTSGAPSFHEWCSSMGVAYGTLSDWRRNEEPRWLRILRTIKRLTRLTWDEILDGKRYECRNVHEPPKDTTFWPAPHFKCSECGATHVSMEYVFYCPNCGRRVVDE